MRFARATFAFVERQPERPATAQPGERSEEDLTIRLLATFRS